MDVWRIAEAVVWSVVWAFATLGVLVVWAQGDLGKLSVALLLVALCGRTWRFG